MLVIAIDGACRRNGKPDCVSAGGVFIMQLDEDLSIQKTQILSNYEVKSTNQRGELLALLTSLDHVYESLQNAQIITDSEYIFNTLTKDWCKNWERKGWITSTGDPVKNKDIWLEIMNAQRRCEAAGCDISFYHIKGHCIPFGKVTAANLLANDTTGYDLYAAVSEKISTTALKDGLYDQIMELSVKNNGFALDARTLDRFVVTNTVADAVATKCVEAADALMK